MDKTQMISINVDGKNLSVPNGVNVIEAMNIIGKEKEVPHYCYHPKLSIAGNCRMCLVEIGSPIKNRDTGDYLYDDNGNKKIGWIPKPVIGCSTIVTDEMHIKTNSEVVVDSRNGVTEFLLINHPLDCPICDQAGECRLQEFSAEHGRGYSRFKEEKNVKPKRTKLGPRVMLDDERCISCSRCVRFSQEVVKDDVLGFTNRGTHSTLTCYPGKELSNNYSLNTVDICPVGALTSTDFRFKMRVWFLKKTPSICTESSVGCNTEVWSREGKIYRITPRRNDDVNDTWMTDSGREIYKLVDSEKRLINYLINDSISTIGEVIDKINIFLNQGNSAIIASAQNSVEEQYLIKKIIDKLKAEVVMAQHILGGDGILLSEDRTPNLRGAFLNGLIHELPCNKLNILKESIDSGSIETLILFNEDIVELGFDIKDIKKKVKIIYLGTHENPTSKNAHIVIPTLMVFEKEGSFVNQNFILQKFNKAIPGPKGVLSDLEILCLILEKICGVKNQSDLVGIWKNISNDIFEFNNINWNRIPLDGLPIEKEKYSVINFPEKNNLKYNVIN